MALSYNDLIKNISTSQTEILKNIIDLHNSGRPFDVDITYSTGGFYKKSKSSDIVIEEPILKFDVEPLSEDVSKLEPWGNIPIENESVESVIFDPPFICAPRNSKSVTEPKDGSNIIFKRFSSYYPIYELHASYAHWISEAYRVLKNNGIFVFKCQNTISGGKFYANEEYAWMESERAGFCTIDKFNLLAKARLLSGKIKKQEHARNFNSVFWVFKKDTKNRIDYYKWINDEKAIERLKKIMEESSNSKKDVNS